VYPNRIKLGYTTDLKRRITAHKTTCPTLEILGNWNCSKGAESMIIKIITNGPDVVRIGPEVFDLGDVDAALSRAHIVFGMCP
jgi:hypothetical protein